MRRALAVRGGELTLRGARFTPDGLVVRGRTLPWDDVGGGQLRLTPETWPGAPAAGWSFHLVPHGTWVQSASLVVARYTGAPPHYDEPAETIRLATLTSVFATVSVVRANALASFLRDEPDARGGLADPARAAAVADGLRRVRLWRSPVPGEPMMGDRYDLHWAVLRAYRKVVPRRYADRPPDTVAPPPLEDFVTAARQELPHRLAKRFSDDEVAARVRPYLAMTPWPFAVLR